MKKIILIAVTSLQFYANSSEPVENTRKYVVPGTNEHRILEYRVINEVCVEKYATLNTTTVHHELAVGAAVDVTMSSIDRRPLSVMVKNPSPAVKLIQLEDAMRDSTALVVEYKSKLSEAERELELALEGHISNGKKYISEMNVSYARKSIKRNKDMLLFLDENIPELVVKLETTKEAVRIVKSKQDKKQKFVDSTLRMAKVEMYLAQREAEECRTTYLKSKNIIVVK